MSDSDDDIDDLLLGTVGKSSKKSNGAKQRARDFTPSEGSDSEASESAGGFVHPYPLEGKYKNQEDRDRIIALSEIERETILYDRDREVQDLVEKDKLSARLKERNAQQAADARNAAARRSEREAATPKSSAMLELKRKREAKTNKSSSKVDQASKRSKRDYYSSDEDAEEEIDQESIYSDEEIDSPATRRALEKETDEQRAKREAEEAEGAKNITFSDALQIRISRKSCMKFLYYPQFSETAIGCFVRISVASSDGRPAYRLCQVSALEEAHRTYKLPNGEQCKRAVKCSHGRSDRLLEFTFVSDSAFTQEEFDIWCRTMETDKMRLMNRRKLKSKLQSLKEMGEHRLTNAEINAMVEEKKRLSKIPPNVAAEKIRLSGLIAEATNNKDEARLEELQNELAKIEELTANRGRNGDLDRLSKLNERNRHQNLKAVGKAETENADKRRQAEKTGGSVGGDPFSRLKTRPRMFYESTPTSPAPGSPLHTPANGASTPQKQNTPSKSRTMGRVDNLIGNIDIDLDL